MIALVIQYLLFVLPMVKIWHFSGIFDQRLSLDCGSVKAKFKTVPGCWFLCESCELRFPKFTDNNYTVSSNIHLKADPFLPRSNYVNKSDAFSLFETSVNGNVTFAYIMTFHCTSV